MQKWEYMTADVEYGQVKRIRVSGKNFRNKQLHEFLNDAGQQGWEVCGYAAGGHYSVILKRPLPEV